MVVVEAMAAMEEAVMEVGGMGMEERAVVASVAEERVAAELEVGEKVVAETGAEVRAALMEAKGIVAYVSQSSQQRESCVPWCSTCRLRSARGNWSRQRFLP